MEADAIPLPGLPILGMLLIRSLKEGFMTDKDPESDTSVDASSQPATMGVPRKKSHRTKPQDRHRRTGRRDSNPFLSNPDPNDLHIPDWDE